MSIIEHVISAYKLWYSYLPHIPKTARYTLAEKIDRTFIETVEFLFIASKSTSSEKLRALRQADTKFESVKFLLQILWEIRALDTKKYAALSESLSHIGKMLGGWLKQALNQSRPTEHIR